MHGLAGSLVISCISAWQADERLATCFSELLLSLQRQSDAAAFVSSLSSSSKLCFNFRLLQALHSFFHLAPWLLTKRCGGSIWHGQAAARAR